MRDWTTGSMMALVSMGCVLAGAPALAQSLVQIRFWPPGALSHTSGF